MTGSQGPGRECMFVDVFGNDAATGNPLAVVHDADGLSAKRMQQIARWMNLSETVFLCRPTAPEADYAVRIFALDRELPWAGHPTMGACHSWLDAGGRPREEGRLVQQCGTGLTTIFDDDGQLSFAAPPLNRFERPSDDDLRLALELVGSDGQGLVDAMWIDNGPGWLGLLFRSADAVLALSPLRSWPAALHIGVAGFQPPSNPHALETRAFHTDQQLTSVEDPVTGSFNAAIAQWLVGTGRLPPRYSVSQGGCVGRDGRIHVGSRDGVITVSGQTRTVVRGTCFFD